MHNPCSRHIRRSHQSGRKNLSATKLWLKEGISLMLLSSATSTLFYSPLAVVSNVAWDALVRFIANKRLTLARRLGFDEPHFDAKMSCGDDLSTDISSPSDSSLTISDGVGMIAQCSLRILSTLFLRFRFRGSKLLKLNLGLEIPRYPHCRPLRQ
jgi:hypothetical protein